MMEKFAAKEIAEAKVSEALAKALADLPEQLGELDGLDDLPDEIGEEAGNEQPQEKSVKGSPIGENGGRWLGERGNSEVPRGTVEIETNSGFDAPKQNLIDNKKDGTRRENEVSDELQDKYPESDGYKVEPEVYLRDENGNIVKDPVTGEARRIDFVVTKDGKVVDSVEVTSKTADKTDQSAKEERIRENGGNFIKDSNGNLVEIPQDVRTRIERRD